MMHGQKNIKFRHVARTWNSRNVQILLFGKFVDEIWVQMEITKWI
jgi:hypothetical protein